jgi:hypothetical protein
MKYCVSFIIVALCLLFLSDAFSKGANIDAFHQCLNRTRKDRMNCESGCGMILQDCYERGIFEADDKIKGLMSQIKAKNGESCASLAEMYLRSESQVSGDVVKTANNLTGWIGSELELNFAHQRLDNIQLICKLCTTQ